MTRIRVWDPLVRVFHWSLVAGFALAWATGEEFESLHEWAGYAVGALIALRVVWGFVGTRYARFSQFVPGLATLRGYLGDTVKGREARYIGHNPAGAVMILGLLAVLSGTALTGWLMADPARQALLPTLPQIVAPAFADDDGDEGDRARGGEDALEEVHEALATVMLVLVALHIGGVVLSSVRHRENLVRAMVTGDKRAPEAGDIV